MLAAAAVTLVTAVTVTRGETDPAQPGTAESRRPASAADLAGAWWARAEGDSAVVETLLVLLPRGELVVFDDGRCEVYGSWAASESGLVTLNVYSWVTGCDAMARGWSETLGGTSTAAVDDDTATLASSDGTPLVRLSPADDRSTWPESAGSDADLVAALQAPAESWSSVGLSEGVLPPSLEQITAGRWVPLEALDASRNWPDQPHAMFLEAGAWEGSDGCNGQGGRWALDPATGEWLARTGIQTLMGCNNVDVGGMLAAARSVGLDGEQLVFYDESGEETGRFVQG